MTEQLALDCLTSAQICMESDHTGIQAVNKSLSDVLIMGIMP